MNTQKPKDENSSTLRRWTANTFDLTVIIVVIVILIGPFLLWKSCEWIVEFSLQFAPRRVHQKINKFFDWRNNIDT